MFAYGQTGSGKTHTMLGDISHGGAITATSGLVPRIFDDLLAQMASRSAAAAAADDDADISTAVGSAIDALGTLTYDCHVSMLEIFNETITDLLQPENTNLQIREDALQGIHVENLSKRSVHAGVCLPHAPASVRYVSVCTRVNDHRRRLGVMREMPHGDATVAVFIYRKRSLACLLVITKLRSCGCPLGFVL